MHDLQITATVDETRARVRSLWRTEPFLRSHDDPDGFIHRLIDTFAALPRLWCELDDAAIERSHFLAWMGIVPLRHQYSNPAISDLYYVHEFMHVATMTHAPDRDRDRWAEKIWINERDASLGSEVFIYFELPELRPSTFDFEIWADRYLAREEMVAQHRDDHEAFVRMMEAERERAMTDPAPGDRNEALIASYHRLNVEWAEIWAARYLDVETQMAEFTATAQSNPIAAADALRQWALDRQGDGLCPFEDEARRFAAVLAAARE